MQQGRPDCLSQPKSDHPRGLRRPRAWLRPRRLLLRFAHLYKKPSRLRRTEQAEAFAKFMTEPRFAFGTTHRNRKGEFTVSLSNNRTSSGPIPDRRLSNTASLGQSCQTHAGPRQKEEQPEEAEVTEITSPSAHGPIEPHGREAFCQLGPSAREILRFAPIPGKVVQLPLFGPAVPYDLHSRRGPPTNYDNNESRCWLGRRREWSFAGATYQVMARGNRWEPRLNLPQKGGWV